jgi:5-methylcytosine-specific restriction endonuclease McrA
MPGWKGSNRRQTLPRDWPARVAHVLNRDRRRCRHIREDTNRPCGLPANQVDHVIPHDEGGTDAYSNLQALCEWHHNRKSGAEGGRASGRARAAKKAAEKSVHPGLLPKQSSPGDPAPF